MYNHGKVTLTTLKSQKATVIPGIVTAVRKSLAPVSPPPKWQVGQCRKMPEQMPLCRLHSLRRGGAQQPVHLIQDWTTQQHVLKVCCEWRWELWGNSLAVGLWVFSEIKASLSSGDVERPCFEGLASRCTGRSTCAPPSVGERSRRWNKKSFGATPKRTAH